MYCQLVTLLLGFAFLISSIGAAGVSQIDKVGNDALFAEAFAQFLPRESDPLAVSGFFGFQSVKENDGCRFSGSFDGGLVSSNPADYKLTVETSNGNTLADLSKIFHRIQITSPSSGYVQETFPKAELDCSSVARKTLVLYLNGQSIGSASITAIV